MECLNCGAGLGREDHCPNCGVNVKAYKKIIMASNAYYNQALQKAEVRNLSGAIESLNAGLRLYKLNINARNLLGLLYFERGEVVEALTEWVISKNYRPKDNAASRYLDEIQSNRSRLESFNQTIKKYNQALLYCQQDSTDLAVIQLKKVLSMNPKLVRGHQLLALLYLQDRKFDLAKKSLQNAIRIDANNTITLRYLQEVDGQGKETASGKKKKADEQVAYQSGNETIIQPRYLKESSAAGMIINIVVGIAIGAAITGFLIVPGVRRQMQNKAKDEVLEANNTISSKNQMISTLEAQIDELTSQMDKAKGEEENTVSRISTYEQLVAAFSAYVASDIAAAGDALANVNTEYLNDESKNVYNTINAQVNADYVRTLYETGYNAYNAQNFAEAAANLQKVVDLDENYEQGYAIYYLAQAYRKSDNPESAKIYYQKIIELYPGTERARTAQNYVDTE